MFLNIVLSFLNYNLKGSTMIKALVPHTQTVLFKICCLKFSPFLFVSTEMSTKMRVHVSFSKPCYLFPIILSQSSAVIPPSPSSCPNPQCLTKKRSQTWQPSALSAFLPSHTYQISLFLFPDTVFFVYIALPKASKH